jgi:hypothetical protein
MHEQSPYATAERAPTAAASDDRSLAPARRPWDVLHPIAVTPAEARLGATRTLYFHQADGRVATVSVSVPAGLSVGTLVTVAGQGAPDPWGRGRGDLLVPVSVVPEQRLEWWGNDARLFVKLTSRDLAEGKQVVVDEPAIGPLSFSVPPGSADGDQLHWKGRGRGRPAGDLYVRLECLDPVPAIVARAAEPPDPAPRLRLWALLALAAALLTAALILAVPALLAL